MSLMTSLNISASGMTAQRTRMDIIAQNVANVSTTLLCHQFLHGIFAALFGDAGLWVSAGVHAGQFLGLGLYAGCRAHGSFADIHGEGGKDHWLYAHGNSRGS